MRHLAAGARSRSRRPRKVSLKPPTKWKGVTAAVVALALGGFFVWKGVAKKKTEDEGARMMQSDPSKRFHIYVKSDPPGADIFVEGEATPIGETPVTIPIDLNGKSSLKLILRKDGYEDYDQRVINDVPLSINLKKHEVPGEAPKPAEPPAPPSAPVAPEPSQEPSDRAEGREAARSRPTRPAATRTYHRADHAERTGRPPQAAPATRSPPPPQPPDAEELPKRATNGLMFRGRSVAVVIPAYNERDTIAATIRSVPGYVDHIIVVDDGSSDGTAAAARRHAARRRGGVVEVLRHDVNRGVGAAIASGYARAVALGVDATAVMAGDGQMDPADLPRLLEPIVEGRADYAKGNRCFQPGPGGWRDMPPTRMVGNVAALARDAEQPRGTRASSTPQCGYTAASRRALLAIGPERMFARYGYPDDLLVAPRRRRGARRRRARAARLRPGVALGACGALARRAADRALARARLLEAALVARRGPRPLEALADALVPVGDGT